MQRYDELAEGATPTFLVAQDDQLLQLVCQEVYAAFPSLAQPGASLRRQSGSSGEAEQDSPVKPSARQG